MLGRLHSQPTGSQVGDVILEPSSVVDNMYIETTWCSGASAHAALYANKLIRMVQVLEAQIQQLRKVNTNSRYLSEVHSQYLRALTAKFPDPLKLLYLVNSGSEANDLALRIAMAARPHATHIACMDGAYHGHVSSMMHASPYKFWGPRGPGGPPQRTHVLPLPDVRRCSPHCHCMCNSGEHPSVHKCRGPCDALVSATSWLSVFINPTAGTAGPPTVSLSIESVHKLSQSFLMRRTSLAQKFAGGSGSLVEKLQEQSSGGWRHRARGLQPSFVSLCFPAQGRCFCRKDTSQRCTRKCTRMELCSLQTRFNVVLAAWEMCSGGFSFMCALLPCTITPQHSKALAFYGQVPAVQGVVPDIVTMGKAMGNGYPIACVATSKGLSDSFAAGPVYFNTFGGGTAACASALAVLNVMEYQQLQENARTVGKCLLDQLKVLMDGFPHIVGDVRGRGLLIGIEVVASKDGKEASPARARWISENLKTQRVRFCVSVFRCTAPVDCTGCTAVYFCNSCTR